MIPPRGSVNSDSNEQLLVSFTLKKKIGLPIQDIVCKVGGRDP